MLPTYLQFATDGAPRPDSVVICGDVRFTVVTSELVRIERGAFTDGATLVVLHRAFGEAVPTVRREGSVTLIDTGRLCIRYDEALSLEMGLTVCREESPAFHWRWGQKPLQNLGGTASTLDCCDGPTLLMDGLCSIDGFALLDDSASPCFTPEGWFAPRKPCTDLYFFGYGRDYTRCVQDYLRLTGAPGLLPAWALGNWWSRYYPYTDESYLALMDRFHQEDVPLSVGIVDMDWHLTRGENRAYGDGWTGYTWNRELFPDHVEFIRQLHRRGLKTALNLHPAQGVRPWDDQYEAMCAALGQDPGEGKPVPFFCLDENFLKAYFEILHFPYEKDGVDFWWMDWQQGTDHKAVAGDSYRETGLDAISQLWMLNHMHYIAAGRNGGRPMVFSRFAGYGSQRYPIGFSGDTYITWRSLKFQPVFTAKASNVGYGWWSHDIGGHMGGSRDDELTARWVQLGVFSPIFRLHSSNSPFLGREPWNYNPRTEAVIKDCMRLRHRLFPYLYTMNRRAHAELLPLVRPMYHVHPEATDAYQVDHEYWFGSEMIVAPVTDPANETGLAPAEVWFPEGVWTDACTGYIYRSNQRVTVWRELEEMPVFLKAGAILPTQKHIPGSNALGGAAEMEVTLAPGASNRFNLYEDDGVTLGYRQGQSALTSMTLDWQEKAATFTIHPVEGETALVPARRWTLRLIGFRKGCTFEVAGQSVAARWDAAHTTYTLDLPEIAPTEGMTVAIRNDGGLTHDNSDIRERYMQRLTRAQGSTSAKQFMLMRFDDAIEYRRTHPYLHVSTDTYPTLEGILAELLAQWNP